MTACPPLSFTGVNRAAWERICASLATQHPELGDPTKVPVSGNVSANGYTLEWSWIEAAATLMVQCIESPWWAPCAMVNTGISDIVNAARMPQGGTLT